MILEAATMRKRTLLALAAELETAQPWFDCVPAVKTHGTDHSLHDGLHPLGGAV
jgi:hypothetical protein